MSIASIADGAVQRKRGSSAQVVPQKELATARTITPLKGATEVARYIPTEAIAIYIAILAGAFGQLSPSPGKTRNQLDYSSRWHFFFAMLGVTAGLVWLLYAAKTRAYAVDHRKRDVPIFEMALATLAMAVWAAALPDSPFADFDWYGGWFAGTVLASATTLIPVVATAFGRAVPSYEEVTVSASS